MKNIKSLRRIMFDNGIVFLKSDNICPGSSIPLPNGKRAVVLPRRYLKEMEVVLDAKSGKQEKRL
jgi:hypothetical protein